MTANATGWQDNWSNPRLLARSGTCLLGCPEPHLCKHQQLRLGRGVVKHALLNVLVAICNMPPSMVMQLDDGRSAGRRNMRTTAWKHAHQPNQGSIQRAPSSSIERQHVAHAPLAGAAAQPASVGTSLPCAHLPGSCSSLRRSCSYPRRSAEPYEASSASFTVKSTTARSRCCKDRQNPGEI